ncbi:hypothetical protein ABZ318_11355 [Streptomyces sp. NPDC006197]|uniref:hypothetical protein n=1 Tax=Streptomyces sp. NPDC006197 TaxID=3156685 RepID=UPI0033B51342
MTRHNTARTAATALLTVLTAGGCGITPTDTVPAGAPASGIQRPGTEARTVQLYFAGPYGIRAVDRPTDRPLSPQQALDLLLEGPTPAERERGLVTQVPPMAGRLTATATDGAVDLYVPRAVGSGDLDVTAVTQRPAPPPTPTCREPAPRHGSTSASTRTSHPPGARGPSAAARTAR